MNDAELDALAKRAAVHTRAEARAVADSDAALARLLAGAATEAPQPLTPVIPYHGPIRDPERRPRWQLAAVAAVLVVFAVGIGYALVNGSGTIEVAGPPAAGTGTGTGTGPSLTAPSSTPPEPTAPMTASPATPSPSEPTATASVTVPTPATTEGTSSETVVLVPQDPFDSWAAPALRPRLLGDVPYLLPGDGRWDDTEVLRSEWESGESDASFAQVWVRTLRASTVVDGALVLTSRRGPMPPVAGEPVDIDGWTTAVERDTVDGVVSFDVASPTGSVTVWAIGLSRAEVITIASSMRTDTDAGAGWLVAPEGDAQWHELDPGVWRVGFASRSVRLTGPNGVTTEVSAVSGLSVGEVGPGLFGSELGITEVGGRVALTFTDATRSAVVWVRDDGVTVSVGSVDPLATTLDLARGLVEVDRVTWESSTVPDPDFGDGCSGLFC